MKYLYLLLLSLFFAPIYICAQEPDYANLTWEDFVSLMADDSDEEFGPDTELFEELYELHINKLNLNTIEEADLHRLPFLSDNDIKNIMFYIDNHRPLFSLGELMFIQSLDRQKRLMMHLFCYTGELKEQTFSMKNSIKYATQELTLRTDIPFYTKAGYSNPNSNSSPTNTNKNYQGNKLYHSLRYSFSTQNHLFVGIQMEKDPGEKYIDHIAGYAMIKNIKCIQTAILGNYRLSFGHGLVLNSGTVFGKTMKLSSMDVIDKGITKQSSTSESGYFRGGAATIALGNIKLSAFFSNRNADGTYNSDSTGISSLKTDGLHRTTLERSKKNNLNITDFGGNIHFDFNKLQFSLTAAATHFNIPLKPKFDTPSTAYRYYNPQGSDFAAYSIAYSYRHNYILFSGETAINSSASLATLNQIQWTPNSYNSLTLIQRQYGAKYNAINARSFSENSQVKNERGIYLGWKSSINSKLDINTYIDAVYFPWIKYNVNNSSYCLEFMSQLSYSPTKKNTFNIRYRYKSKQQNNPEDNSKLIFKTNHNIRMQHIYSASDALSFRSTFFCTINALQNTNSNKGFALGEAIRYQNSKSLRIDASCIYFNTDSYDSRIYNYESSLQYSFAMNSYFDQGFRAILLTSYNLHNKLSLTLKFSSTSYLNKDNIGTNLELINSKHREDLQIQLKYKF